VLGELAALATILPDTQDEPMCNKSLRVAHEVRGAQLPEHVKNGQRYR
jgi:hypothetical protein